MVSRNQYLDKLIAFRDIQVTESIDEEATRKRELRPFELRSLEKITGGYEKIIVVRQGSHPTDIDGIKIVSAVDFLMGRLGA